MRFTCTSRRSITIAGPYETIRVDAVLANMLVLAVLLIQSHGMGAHFAAEQSGGDDAGSADRN